MGMFDWVAFVLPCPTCGAAVKEWQSKDGACGLQYVLPWTVSNFYGGCPECDQHIEFNDGKMVEPMYDTGVELLPRVHRMGKDAPVRRQGGGA